MSMLKRFQSDVSFSLNFVHGTLLNVLHSNLPLDTWQLYAEITCAYIESLCPHGRLRGMRLCDPAQLLDVMIEMPGRFA